jgi:hypothetical protein
MRRWRRSLILKALVWPGRYNFGDLLRTKTLCRWLTGSSITARRTARSSTT